MKIQSNLILDTGEQDSIRFSQIERECAEVNEMPYVILQSVHEDRGDVVVTLNEDGSAMVFADKTEAKEWAEENLNSWYKVVSV